MFSFIFANIKCTVNSDQTYSDVIRCSLPLLSTLQNQGILGTSLSKHKFRVI